MSTTIRIPRKIEHLGASSQFTAARFNPRHGVPEVTVHPVLNGDHRYLRALRAAEMAAWEAGLPREMAKLFAESLARSEAK